MILIMRKIMFFFFLAYIISSCNSEIKGDRNEARNEYVIDSLNLLKSNEKDSLNNVLSNFDKKTSVEVVLYITNSLDGMSIFNYSYNVFDNYKIGKKNFNNGVLIVLAPNQASVQILVGHGLEWTLTDSIVEIIISKMIPFLKTENFYEGIKIGLNDIKLYSEKVSWDISYSSIQDLERDIKNSENKLAVIEIDRIVLKDSLPFSSPINYGYIGTKDNQKIKLKYTKYMDKLITEINFKPKKIIVRISNENPLEVKLIGNYLKN